jgi:hypothetical protein
MEPGSVGCAADPDMLVAAEDDPEPRSAADRGPANSRRSRRLIDRVEANVRTNVVRLRQALVNQADLREVFQAMFPDGLTLEAARTPDGMRQIWEISSDAGFAAILGRKRSDRGFECVATPTGSDANETGRAYALGIPGTTTSGNGLTSCVTS